MTLLDVYSENLSTVLSILLNEGWTIKAISTNRGYRSVKSGYGVFYGHDRKGRPTCRIEIPNRWTSLKSSRYGAVIRLVRNDIDLPF